MTDTPHCLFCPEAGHTVVHNENGYEAWKCNVCGTLYPSPLPQIDTLDPTRDLHEQDWYRLSAKYKLRWLTKRRAAPQTLLEVGCGEGHFLEFAHLAGYQVAGIEPHQDRAERCREKGLNVQTTFLADYTESTTEKFDIIFHVDLLAHFADPILALKQMSSLLKPGGVLFFEVGTLGGLSPWWYEQVGDIGLPHHLWLYSDSSLAELFDRANLEVEEQSCYGLGATVAMVRGIRSLRNIRGKVNRSPSPKSQSQNHRFKLRLHMAARYDLGAIVPKVGPKTHFFLVRPK